MFIINAFSMGAWAAGVTIGAALQPNGIVKSTGPDVEKILNTLRFFGPTYHYLITGYPLFLKHLMMDMVGGKGMSEHLRQYLFQRVEKVLSGSGASDLEVGIAGESDLTIAIRNLLIEQPEVRSAVLGDEQRYPMLFQYNPLDHYIETNADSELMRAFPHSEAPPTYELKRVEESGRDQGDLPDVQRGRR